MAEDHYVARTYLKHFGDPSKGGMLNAYRKSDGKTFPCWPEDVCREWKGDMNPLLSEPNLLGVFRKIFEPEWNAAVATMLAGKVGRENKLVMSGYVANLMTCTPTFQRIGGKMETDHMAARLFFQKRMKEKHGGQPQLPVDAIEAIERGDIVIEANPNYIKARTTRQLMDSAITTYNADWTIIANDIDQPFVTSDNPLAYWDRGPNVRPTVRFLPITPELCLSISYDSRKDKPRRRTPDAMMRAMTTDPQGTVEHVRYNKAGVEHINRVVVQNAEDLVFSRAESDRIETLVKRNAGFRVEIDFVELPADEEDAIVHGSIMAVREGQKQ